MLTILIALFPGSLLKSKVEGGEVEPGNIHKNLVTSSASLFMWISILDSLNLYPLPDNQKLFFTNFRGASLHL